MKVRIISVQVKQSFYVADVKELENLLSKGYEIVAACSIGENYILYTLVMR